MDARSFRLPWMEEPLTVASDPTTWVLRNAPPDGSTFACVPPPAFSPSGPYSGPVDLAISLNPCLSASAAGATGCAGRLLTTAAGVFRFSSPAVTTVTRTLGPAAGGTAVTLAGTGFGLRDTGLLPAGFSRLPPLCSWDQLVTAGVYIAPAAAGSAAAAGPAGGGGVVCVSPACSADTCGGILAGSCPACWASIVVEVDKL